MSPAAWAASPALGLRMIEHPPLEEPGYSTLEPYAQGRPGALDRVMVDGREVEVSDLLASPRLPDLAIQMIRQEGYQRGADRVADLHAPDCRCATCREKKP